MRGWVQLEQVQWQKPEPKVYLSDGVAYGFVGRGSAPANVHHARQVHGTRMALASDQATGGEATRRVEADAVMTMTAGVHVAVKTADCLPVLLWAPHRAVAAVHAGWRGLTSGIIGEAVQTLKATGIQTHELWAVVGPAISREHFQVGDEVVRALFEPASGLSVEQASLCTAKGQKDRWHVDLPVAACFSLLNAGLPSAQVTVMQECTYQEAAWHSYRRDGKVPGSNWSWIVFDANAPGV